MTDKIIRLKHARYCFDCEIIFQKYDICPLCGNKLIFPLSIHVPTIHDLEIEEALVNPITQFNLLKRTITKILSKFSVSFAPLW